MLAAVRRYPEATARLVRLLDESPDDPQLQRNLVDLVAAADCGKETVHHRISEIYRKARDNAFSDLDVQGIEQLGHALRRLELFKEAGVCFEDLHRKRPQDAKVLQALAELAAARQDFAEAVRYCQALVKLRPNDDKARKRLAETTVLLARKEVARGRLDRACELFDASIRLDPPGLPLLPEYAGVLVQAKRLDRAVTVLEQLQDVPSRVQLASVLEMQKDYARAIQILLGLESARALPENGLRSLARMLSAARRYPEAAARLVRLLEQSPHDLLVQRNLVDLVAATDCGKETVRRSVFAIYRECLENGFRNWDVQGIEQLGHALRRLELFEEAGASFKEAVARSPDSRRLRFHLAQTLSHLGRYEDAEAQYKILMEKRPSPTR